MALMQGYHRGAWLVGWGWLVPGSGALSECLQRSPRYHFEQSLANSLGQTRSEGEEMQKKRKKRWMEESRKGDGWIKEEEEEFPLSVLRIHLSVTRTLVHSSACTNTHTQ